MRIALISLGLLLIGVVYYLFDPSKGYLPECPFYKLTDLYCPGCGSQRGLHAILHGDVQAAFGYNHLVVLGLTYVIIETGIWTYNRRQTRLQTLSSRRYTPAIVFIIVLLFWVLRNIPYAPFTSLAP